MMGEKKGDVCESAAPFAERAFAPYRRCFVNALQSGLIRRPFVIAILFLTLSL